MVKNREINGTEEIALVTPTPGGRPIAERFSDIQSHWKDDRPDKYSRANAMDSPFICLWLVFMTTMSLISKICINETCYECSHPAQNQIVLWTDQYSRV